MDPSRPLFHIRTAQGTLEVKLTELKALFFVKDLVGNSGRNDVLALEPSDGRARGSYPIELEFADGEHRSGSRYGIRPYGPFSSSCRPTRGATTSGC